MFHICIINSLKPGGCYLQGHRVEVGNQSANNAEKNQKLENPPYTRL